MQLETKYNINVIKSGTIRSDTH